MKVVGRSGIKYDIFIVGRGQNLVGVGFFFKSIVMQTSIPEGMNSVTTLPSKLNLKF